MPCEVKIARIKPHRQERVTGCGAWISSIIYKLGRNFNPRPHADPVNSRLREQAHRNVCLNSQVELMYVEV